MFRVGTGYDFHVFVTGRPLMLGGVEIPYDRGLLGHSDADVVLHAITDALLGALALGDIGEHFPDDDPKYKGADSTLLLTEAYGLVRDRGYRIVNLDLNILAEKPKLKPYKPQIAKKIATLLETDNVSVKAKTREGKGAVGRSEAIEVHCVVLLQSEQPQNSAKA